MFTVKIACKGTARSEEELFDILGRDDSTELALRRLSTYVYETRTVDRVGGSSMLGASPPGSSLAVAVACPAPRHPVRDIKDCETYGVEESGDGADADAVPGAGAAPRDFD